MSVSEEKDLKYLSFFIQKFKGKNLNNVCKKSRVKWPGDHVSLGMPSPS